MVDGSVTVTIRGLVVVNWPTWLPPGGCAATEVVVHVIDDPEAFLTERPGAALAVLRVTAARLDRMTQYLVDVKQQFSDLDGHLGMVGRILDTLVNHQAPATSAGSARDPEGDHIH